MSTTANSSIGTVTVFTNPTRMATIANSSNGMVTEFENSTSVHASTSVQYDILCQNYSSLTVYFTLYLTAICVLTLCNILLLAAIATNWGTLRQNIVYRYLISCLVSTTCFCLLGGYEICHYLARVDDNIIEGGILQTYDSRNPVQKYVMRGWAYRKSLTVCFFIIMEFNIAVFIHAMCDNTHFVGRFGDLEHANDNRRNKPFDATKRKKYRAVGLILASWIFPLILSIPTGLRWNCMDHCVCLPAFRFELTCFSPDSGVVCSRVWMPTTRSFGVVITVLYFGAILFMFGMLIVVVRKFYKIHAPKKPKTMEDQDKFGSKRNATDGKTTQDSRASNTQETSIDEPKVGDLATSPEAQASVDEPTENVCVPAPVQIARNARPPLHSTIKLLIALTVSLFISVTPTVLIWFFDFLIYPGPMINPHAFDVSLALTYAYSAALPFILLRYMSGLRKACVNMLLRCPCLRTTVITKKRISATIRRTRKKTRKTETCVAE